MGVQLFEHPTDSILDEFLLVDLVDIEVLDGHLGNIHFPQLILRISSGDIHLSHGRHTRQGHDNNHYISFHAFLCFLFLLFGTVLLDDKIIDDKVLALHGVLAHVVLQ